MAWVRRESRSVGRCWRIASRKGVTHAMRWYQENSHLIKANCPRKSNIHKIRMISKEYGVRSSPSRRAAASPSIWHGCPLAQRCKAIWFVLLRMAKSFYDDESKSDVNYSQNILYVLVMP